MMSGEFFCAHLSREKAEPCRGTASYARQWVLLEHPEGWGVKALKENSLPQTVRNHLIDSLEELKGVRFQLIKQSDKKEERSTRSISLYFAFTQEDEHAVYKLSLADYTDLLSLDIPHALKTKCYGLPVESIDSLILVCTDGKHDKCCAKYGMPLYKELRECLGDTVWQTSHIGGDRFAPNLVWFPYGIFYGKIDERSIDKVKQGFQEHTILLDNYRGRCSHSSTTQAADFFVRSHTGIIKVNSLRFLNESLDNDLAIVRFESTEDNKSRVHTATVRIYKAEEEQFLTCSATKRGRPNRYELISIETREC